MLQRFGAFQLLTTSNAATDMVLNLELGVIGKFVIDVENQVFLCPIAFHNQKSPENFLVAFYRLIGASVLRNFCVALNKVFLAVSSVVFSISPIVRSRSP